MRFEEFDARLSHLLVLLPAGTMAWSPGGMAHGQSMRALARATTVVTADYTHLNSTLPTIGDNSMTGSPHGSTSRASVHVRMSMVTDADAHEDTCGRRSCSVAH